MDGYQERVVKTDAGDACFGSDLEMGDDLSEKLKVDLTHLSAVE